MEGIDFEAVGAHRYDKDNLKASDALFRANMIAYGPLLFQTVRICLKYGIYEDLRQSDEGLRLEELSEKSGLSLYAVRLLIESSLTAEIVYRKGEKYLLARTGYFLLMDDSIRVNIDWNHDVNYLGFFDLEASLVEGKPKGLKVFGEGDTIYPMLKSLPDKAKESWFKFDHFYSDNAFGEALKVIFTEPTNRIWDVGGNTGKFAKACIAYDDKAQVTVVDLPEQLTMLKEAVKDIKGGERISGHAIDWLSEGKSLPKEHPDVIWMSQFLDCFSPEQVEMILKTLSDRLEADGRICIMELLWDRHPSLIGGFSLTQISLYFACMANGCSKMYGSTEFMAIVNKAGLEIVAVHDNLGWGHTLLVCKKR